MKRGRLAVADRGSSAITTTLPKTIEVIGLTTSRALRHDAAGKNGEALKS